MGFALFIY